MVISNTCVYYNVIILAQTSIKYYNTIPNYENYAIFHNINIVISLFMYFLS